jgi:hypothetical protein
MSDRFLVSYCLIKKIAIPVFIYIMENSYYQPAVEAGLSAHDAHKLFVVFFSATLAPRGESLIMFMPYMFDELST